MAAAPRGRRFFPRAPDSVLAGIAPAVGEVVFNQTKKRVHIGNGVRLGGLVLVADEDLTGTAAGQGADFIALKSSAAGSVARTAFGKLDETHSAKDAGAAADGIADDLAALTAFGNAAGRVKIMPAGNYKLSGEWKPPAQDMVMIAAGDVAFTGNHPDFENLIPFQNSLGPIWSQILASKTYGAGWAGTGNIFQIGSHVTSNVASVPVVAVFGQGRAIAASSKVWGGNFVAYADHATGTSIAMELNLGVLTAGGSAYGLVIASAGTAGQPKNAIQIQSNNVASQYIDGINFNWRSTEGLLTGSVLRVNAPAGAVCDYFVRITGVHAALYEIEMPSLLVVGTPSTVASRLQLRAASGSTPRIEVDSTLVDANIQIRPKGAGQSQLAGSAGSIKFAVSEAGLGFHGIGPQTRQTITGARGGNAALADLLAKLDAVGLIINSTTA